MPYVLEKITADHVEKIISDAVSDPQRQRSLVTAKKYREFPDTWAVDRARNCYLLLKPRPEREEMFDTPYYMFARGRMYTIRTEGTSHRVYFEDEDLPSPQLLQEIQQEITAAFAVYGRWGRGPLESGKPARAVIPEFTTKRRG